MTEIEHIGTTAVSNFDIANAFDGDVDTMYKASTADDCYIGFNAGDDYLFILESF